MALMDGMTAISARHARDLEMVDELVDGPASAFDADVAQRAEALAHHRDFRRLLARRSESFFGPDRAYHEARRRFVLKRPAVVAGSRGDEIALSAIRLRRALMAARWSGVSAAGGSAS